MKNQIYELVLGGHFIHIGQGIIKTNYSFTNVICQAKISEEEAQRNFDSEDPANISEEEAQQDFEPEDPAKWYVEKNEYRHYQCDRDHTYETVNLSLLRTCRQIYGEAKYFPYSTNTFSFIQPGVIKEFTVWLERTSAGYNKAIRSMHIEFVIACFNDEKRWESSIKNLARRLPNVENVNLSLDQRYILNGCRNPTLFEYGRGNRMRSILLSLRTLPIKRATFEITDARGLRESQWSIVPEYEQMFRWTLDEKRVWARYVKEALCQPNK